jgi:hypothetical protein
MNKLLLPFVAGAALCLAADPFVGVWKPDPAKCKTSPGAPEVRKTTAITCEAQGKDQYRVIGTTPDGKTQYDGVWILDGEEHGKSANVYTQIAFERIDDRHIHGKTVGPKGSVAEDWVVSADGKTQTWTRKGTGTTTGRPVDDFYFYDKRQ